MPLEIDKFGLSTTDHNSTVFNVSPEEPYLQKVGAGSDEVTLSGLGGKYLIDVYADVQNFSPKDFPFLTITANLGGKGMTAPYDTWTDDYEGDMWADIKLDDLRESSRNKNKDGAPTLYGGRLAWKKITTPPSDGVDAVINANPSSELALATGNILTLAFDTSSDYIRGKKEEVIRKLANLMTALKYEKAAIAGATKVYQTFAYKAGTSVRIFMCFEDVALKCGNKFYQKHEIIVGIKEFWFNEDYSELCITLDFGESNFDNLDATATNNVVLLEEVAFTAGTAFNAEAVATGYYTRFSRMVMFANYGDVPDPIAEGSNFTEGTNFIYGQDSYSCYTQIFQSDKYGITGTRLATKLRFRDDWLETRKRKMMLYKAGITAAMLYGKQSMSYDPDTGLPIRSMSGMFDFEAYPIRYMRSKMPDIASDTVNGARFKAWLDDLAYSLNAYKMEGSDSNTLLCSRSILQKMNEWVAYIGTTSSNIFGSIFHTAPPSQATLQLSITEYTTACGTLRFIHEPALDYMPKFPAGSSTRGGIPEHLFTSGMNPRNTIIAIDKGFINFMTYRPDRIEGELQAHGQDMYQEAIRGEHSMKLRFPRNHAVIYVG